MKSLQIELIMEELNELNARINPEFLNIEQIDVPILKQVELLLDAIGDKGLKLTAKGNLPTKVVKEIALCCPTESDKLRLEYTSRYLEDEQVSAMRTRVVSEIGKLVRVSKNKMIHGTMAEAYRNASQAEKFIYLFWQFKKVNLAYFDRMQETSLLNSVSLTMLQIVRDKASMYRGVNVYSAFLLDALPGLAGVVEEEIELSTYFSKDPFNEFESLLEQRLFKNFFAHFGFVVERGADYNEEYECRKTDLLDSFLLPFDEVDTGFILNKKQFRIFSQRIKKDKLDIELFRDLCFIYAHAARHPLKPYRVIAENLVKAQRVIGTAAKVYEEFYVGLANATEQTLKYFTQLEVKGGGGRADSMKKDFISFTDGIYGLLPKDKPHNMMMAIQAIPIFFIDMLNNVHKIDIAAPDFYAECEKHFNEETAEDIGAVIYLMGELQKRSKKLKRINSNMETMVKEAINAFVIAVMSIYTYEMDS